MLTKVIILRYAISNLSDISAHERNYFFVIMMVHYFAMTWSKVSNIKCILNPDRVECLNRADSRFAPSQRKTSLQSNTVSH